MSSSQHPVALRLEGLVGGDETLLATVMGLPLVDGIFPALVLAGALDSAAGIVQVGLLIFGGSATLAVVLAEMEGSRRSQVRAVLVVGAGLVTLAAAEAALAPTIRSALDLATFERFAALVIAAVAAKTASATVGEYLPSPGVVVALGLVASLRPRGFEFAVVLDPALVARAAAAAGVGVAFALGVALAGPRLRRAVHVDRFRFGSAVALGLLPLSILGMPFGRAPLAVVAVAGLLALDPEGDGEAGVDSATADRQGDATPEAATDGGPAPVDPATAATPRRDPETTRDRESDAGVDSDGGVGDRRDGDADGDGGATGRPTRREREPWV